MRQSLEGGGEGPPLLSPATPTSQSPKHITQIRKLPLQAGEFSNPALVITGSQSWVA